MEQSVDSVIAAHQARWSTNTVDVEVFGTGDPAGIAKIVDRYCVEQLGVGTEEGLFYGASAGCVLGVRLADGAQVVIKAYQERWLAPFLRAVQTVQAHAARHGIPCAAPLRGPSPLVPGRPNQAIVESSIPDPGMRPYASVAERRVSAAGLARQIAACRELPALPPLADHPLRTPAGGLYGEPHSPLFDFGATTAGAEWIDALALRAVSERNADEPPVIAHMDWAARNVRLDAAGLLAVYDWDSVALVPESNAVGQAAVTWSVTADPGGTEFPTLPDIEGFVADYEEAAGYRLDETQWRAVGQSAAWVLAYTARCEHSLDAKGMARPDQHAARDRLVDVGEALLALRPDR